MDYDAIIIGAGMSGLGAGIRLAYFDKRVLIIDKHNVYGGLNSFYTLDGRRFDVGLHALTNYVPPGTKNAPLSKLLRQLRIPRDALDLREQSFSEIAFPQQRMRFTNNIEVLIEEVRRAFPDQIDAFIRLINIVKEFDDLSYSVQWRSSRQVLGEQLSDPLLVDMLLCPLMFYGSADEDDMDWTQFVTMFKSIYLQGFARPRQGVRRIIAELVRQYRECNGEFLMGCAVERIVSDGQSASSVILQDGRSVSAPIIFSSAGYFETMKLCGQQVDSNARVGKMTFVESISVLDISPAELGTDATIVFFNNAERFSYRPSDKLIDPRSGVICCPNNYAEHDALEGMIRITSIANYDAWLTLDSDSYLRNKEACYQLAADHATKFVPEFRDHVVYCDIFTPKTIERFTSHINGAVYGSPHKLRDGRTHLDNLFICGTDQGFLGIVGALLSGISMANLHVLSSE